jgi:hypothetical protein
VIGKSDSRSILYEQSLILFLKAQFSFPAGVVAAKAGITPVKS